MISICANCDGGPELARAIREAVGDAMLVRLTGCMNACARPVAVAVREPGREAYLFGDVTAAEAPAFATFVAQYRATPRGRIEDATPLGALRFCLIGRIPA